MATTYCNRADIASIIGEPAVVAWCDDDQSGDLSPVEEAYITGAISRAAVEMNEKIRHQYGDLSAIVGNDWARWCNAYIACWMLASRRANAPPGSVIDAVINYRDMLTEIRWGRTSIPEQAPSHDFAPAVSNPTIELNNLEGPVAIDTDISTGSTPDGTRRRNVARMNRGWA